MRTTYLASYSVAASIAAGTRTSVNNRLSPVAIHKLNRCLLNLHVPDIDPTMRGYVPIGKGVMDIKAIAGAVKAIGFTGFLSLEQDYKLVGEPVVNRARVVNDCRSRP